MKLSHTKPYFLMNTFFQKCLKVNRLMIWWSLSWNSMANDPLVIGHTLTTLSFRICFPKNLKSLLYTPTILVIWYLTAFTHCKHQIHSSMFVQISKLWLEMPTFPLIDKFSDFFNTESFEKSIMFQVKSTQLWQMWICRYLDICCFYACFPFCYLYSFQEWRMSLEMYVHTQFLLFPP